MDPQPDTSIGALGLESLQLVEVVFELESCYQVQVDANEVEGIGEVTWLCIVARDRSPTHDWRDMQRIKNELCGSDREACELYPAESRHVDTCNQYHLFVMPAGMRFPFGYESRDVSDRFPVVTKHKQRAFEVVPPDLNARVDESLDQRVDFSDPPESVPSRVRRTIEQYERIERAARAFREAPTTNNCNELDDALRVPDESALLEAAREAMRREKAGA